MAARLETVRLSDLVEVRRSLDRQEPRRSCSRSCAGSARASGDFGEPGSPQGRIAAQRAAAAANDPGIAVYFTLGKKRVVLACDKWAAPQENIYAIAKHVEALRGQDRWGVGSIEQAFAGYMALEERTGPSCFEILGISLTRLSNRSSTPGAAR
jgi:hypothetical protein